MPFGTLPNVKDSRCPGKAFESFMCPAEDFRIFPMHSKDFRCTAFCLKAFCLSYLSSASFSLPCLLCVVCASLLTAFVFSVLRLPGFHCLHTSECMIQVADIQNLKWPSRPALKFLIWIGLRVLRHCWFHLFMATLLCLRYHVMSLECWGTRDQ